MNSSTVSPSGMELVRLSRRAGLIKFNRCASERIGLTEKTQVTILQDADNPEDWYIYKSVDGFKIMNEKGRGSHMFNNIVICRKLLDSINGDSKRKILSCSFKIANTPVIIDGKEYWLILTRGKINAK